MNKSIKYEGEKNIDLSPFFSVKVQSSEDLVGMTESKVGFESDEVYEWKIVTDISQEEWDALPEDSWRKQWGRMMKSGIPLDVFNNEKLDNSESNTSDK